MNAGLSYLPLDNASSFVYMRSFHVRSARRAVLAAVIGCFIPAPAQAQPAPHASHEARLGGILSPAAADTLHAEAVWSEQRRLRLFVTNASAEPLPIERLREIEARVLIGEQESPFQLLELEGYFEARIPTLGLPAAMIVELRVPAMSADRVALTFRTYSEDVRGFGSAAPPEIPDTLAGIIEALAEDRRAAQAAFEHGQFAAMSEPEERIRERAIAIEPHLASLSPALRAQAKIAITAVVRACWLLHMSLDYGNLPQREAAIRQVGETLDRLTGLLAGTVR